MIFYRNDDSGRKGAAPAPIDILIGCPIQKRDWIITDWYWHAIGACKAAGLKPGFLFVMDPTEEPLNTMAVNFAANSGVDLWVVPVEEVAREDKRVWSSIRYERMVELRNLLLGAVREINPPLFLSLDSDILLHSDSIASMVETLNESGADAVGGKTFMAHAGTSYPSYGKLGHQNSLQRSDSKGRFQVDVIMAIKLMTPAAYGVDYVYDSQGEDIGWSKQCKSAGLKLVWDGSVVNKHVMRKQDISKLDSRCGY